MQKNMGWERVSNCGKHSESNRLLLQDGTSNIAYYKSNRLLLRLPDSYFNPFIITK